MTTAIEITSSYLVIKDGLFDSRDRFLRQVTNTSQADFWMTQGATMKVDQSTWRWECGPLTFVSHDDINSPAPGFASDKAVAVE